MEEEQYPDEQFNWVERYTWRGRVKRLKMRLKRKNPVRVALAGVLFGGAVGACVTLALMGL